MSLQWAPGHDNEAGYVDILPNTAGQSVAVVRPIRYPSYVTAADGTVKAKGAPFTEIEMVNVPVADYIAMRETDLGFTSAESDVSKEITISLPELDRATFNDWNATVTHRPGEDTEYDDLGGLILSMTWRVIITEAT